MLMASMTPEPLDMTEEQCVTALKEARWPNGFRCPLCGYRFYYAVNGRRLPLYECASCRYQCSLITGTIMERSRVPLRKWFAAIDLIARQPISAVALSAILDVTYKTAWLMLHKLRDAMSRHNERDFLTGIVRFSVAISGKQPIPSLNGLHPQEHPFIVGGTMAGDKKSRVLKIMLMQDTGGDTRHRKILLPGARKFIERYVDLQRAAVDLDNILEPGPVKPYSLTQIGDNIDYAIKWTHCGIGPKHLQAYLHEHAYRFNRTNEYERPGSSLTAAESTVYRYAPAPPYHSIAAQDLLRLAASTPAPARKAFTSRAVPGKADWTVPVDLFRMSRAYAAFIESLRQAA